MEWNLEELEDFLNNHSEINILIDFSNTDIKDGEKS